MASLRGNSGLAPQVLDKVLVEQPAVEQVDWQHIGICFAVIIKYCPGCSVIDIETSRHAVAVAGVENAAFFAPAAFNESKSCVFVIDNQRITPPVMRWKGIVVIPSYCGCRFPESYGTGIYRPQG